MDSSHLVAGLRDLNSASKLLFIASILGLVAGAALLLLVPALFFTAVSHAATGLSRLILTWLPLIMVSGALALASAIIGIYAVYAKLLPSSKHFAEWRPANFETPRKLLYIGYWGALVLALLALVSGVALLASIAPLFMRGSHPEGLMGMLVMLLAPLALLVLAAILAFVGFVGEVMLFYELGTALASERFKQVALLTIAYYVGGMLLAFIPVFTVTLPLSLVASGLQIVAYYLAMEESARLLASLPSQQSTLQGQV
ncbi:DUF973 family protein [Infirmifilum lucidum]|uniref:DUF973 family protein n=1 Tax=Infirmifilum lucidum TaxID=2776706 RepID=A0A7L9FIK9_9CREN|nr:DUF973 family protein [Infirmifilum lucidum]QOJ78863.1 DUF973 family protein [Infirmifilum lucidum]